MTDFTSEAIWACSFFVWNLFTELMNSHLDFPSLLESALVICAFQRIFMAHLNFWIYWHKVIHIIFLISIGSIVILLLSLLVLVTVPLPIFPWLVSLEVYQFYLSFRESVLTFFNFLYCLSIFYWSNLCSSLLFLSSIYFILLFFFYFFN